MSTPELRELVREEVTRQVDARMDGVNTALVAITESNQAIERAAQALSRSNTEIARVLQKKKG